MTLNCRDYNFMQNNRVLSICTPTEKGLFFSEYLQNTLNATQTVCCMVVRQHSICNNSFVMSPTAADPVLLLIFCPAVLITLLNSGNSGSAWQPRLPVLFTRQLNFYCQMLLCKHNYIDFDTDVNNHAALKASRRSPEDR